MFKGIKNMKRQQPKLNPVTTYRSIGEYGLRDKTKDFEISELITIIRYYCPDINGKIYRSKDKQTIINYMVERSEKLSMIGQVFRGVSEKEPDNNK